MRNAVLDEAQAGIKIAERNINNLRYAYDTILMAESEEELKKLPYDPATQLLGIYSDKTITQKDTCTPMLIAILVTTAKTWKQPKCPSTEK